MSHKLNLYLPVGADAHGVGATPISKPSHRKMPSLYLKSNYISNTNNAGIMAASRHSSIERGVTSFSKDQLNASNGRISVVPNSSIMNTSNIVESANRFSVTSPTNQREKLNLTTSAYMLPDKNKLEKEISNCEKEKQNERDKNSQERVIERLPSASSSKRVVSKPIIRTAVIKSRKDSRAQANVSMNSSVDKLKKTFNLGVRNKTPDETNPELLLKEIGKPQGSTNYTAEPELTIQWRDDITIDMEKELTFTSCLGQGSFAKVYEGYDKKSKMNVAIKVIDKRKILEPKRRNLIQQEVNLLARMKHPNIAEFYRLVEDHKRLFIVMQLCGTLTLNHFCRQFSGKRLNEEQSFAVFSQIVKGVKHMHDHNVAHRDLKLTNILIDEEYTVKIIDFGFACEANEKHKMYCGTPSYMAPEIVEKKIYMPKPVDIWAMGVILFKLLTGEYAFGGKSILTQPRMTRR